MAFTLTTQLEFSAAHRLRGYDGNCARLHGHNWKVEISLTGSQLNDVGMLIDFKEIKRTGKHILAQLDHYYLNDIPPFDAELNPTAENIAKYICESLQVNAAFQAEKIDVQSVQVWESPRSAVMYKPEG